MKYRELGRNGPRVSAIGLGRGSQPVRFGEPLEREFNATIHRAIELGVTFFDSSDAYWSARHEELLGRALKDHRGRVKIATKFGNLELPDGGKATNGRPEFVQSACEASLRRLGAETIDVYYLHRVDPATPIEDTVGAMARLVEQGKVRHLGICEAGPETLRRAHAAHPLAALQTEYSLWFRDIERDMLPVCRELGIAYVAYAPLGRGLLTGRIKTVDDLPVGDRRRRHPRFTAENLARNTELVRQLEAVAAARRVPPAQVAIAWLLAQGDDIVPIPGTNHVKNLEQNVASVSLALTAEELHRLNDIFTIGAGAGPRYPERTLRGVGL
jgi:aryl-alcohol dehydrogenase-like predicted oxidoreductase